MKNIQIPIKDIKKLKTGVIVRRKNKQKDQQGFLVRFEEDGLVLINVIDLKKGQLYASEGILRPQDDDQLYYYNSSFKNNPISKKALEIVKDWQVYKKNKIIEQNIIQFVCITFVPEQILEWQKKDTLSKLFIPIKQKFRLENYKERRSVLRVYKDIFKTWLDGLKSREHVTYVAFIPRQSTQFVKFYSAGKLGHSETENNLFQTPYTFKPTHGGHIKFTEIKNDRRNYIVDAGSTYLGRGVKTPLHFAQEVVKALRNNFPEEMFTPVKGRGAFGS